MSKNENRFERLTKAFFRDNFAAKDFKRDARFADCKYVTSAGIHRKFPRLFLQ